MKVLVTGGAGFIGSHTTVELLEAGFDVVVVDDLSLGKYSAIEAVRKITGKEVPFVKLDLKDEKATIELMEEIKPDAVVHFAAYKSVHESISQPLEYYKNNMESGFNVLAGMKKTGCRILVFSSSATVYGDNPEIPFDESVPHAPTTAYGRTKSQFEFVMRDICTADENFAGIALRYFNPVGAHESGMIGEDSRGIPNSLFPYITQVAVGRREKLFVFGNDYDTVDGSGVRDFIHVTDLARGHVAALKWAEHNSGFEAFNLGQGKGESVLEVIAAFEKACGKPLPHEIVGRRSGDVPASICKAEKAEKVLGWKAEMDIDKICQDAWRWQKMNPNGLKDNE